MPAKPSSVQAHEAKLEKLRAQWAAAQAVADQLRARLARAEARAAGEPPPESGLEMLWAAAPPIARTRSSKYACRAAWNRIPQADRPRVADAVAALRAWCRCEEWRRDEGQFVPALHRWIKERRWEDPPQSGRHDPRARYRCDAPALPQVAPEDQASPEEIAASFAALRSKLI
jgi:hypothetical protein